MKIELGSLNRSFRAPVATSATLYSNKGDDAKAEPLFQRALAMKNDKLAGEIRQRLEMYQTGVGPAESTDRVR